MQAESPPLPRGNRLLAALPKADRALLAPHLNEDAFSLGALLQEAGQPFEKVYFPLAGMISLLAVMENGQGIETATVGIEGVVGAMAGFGPRKSFTRAVAQAPLRVAWISAPRFQLAIKSSDRLRHMLASYNETLLAQVQQTAACNALHAARARLARWLLQTRDRTDSDELPLTQEFLAQMLGVQRTTVTMIARQLEKAGWIQYRRGKIFIVNRAGLKTVACECYSAIRAQLQAALPEVAP